MSTLVQPHAPEARVAPRAGAPAGATPGEAPSTSPAPLASMDVWRRALGVLLLGAAVTAVMDRLLFAGEARVGDLRGLHLLWSGVATVSAALAAVLVWPRGAERPRSVLAGIDLSELPQEPLLRVQRRLLAHAFARSLAHDGNNVLLALRFRVAELARLEQDRVHGGGPVDNEAASLVHELGHACDEFEGLLGRLRELGRQSDRPVMTELDLDVVLPRILDFAAGHTDVRLLSPQVEIEPGLVIQADIILLRQALTNLLLNAAQAATREGRMALRARRGLGQVLIEVHDGRRGPPVPADAATPDQPAIAPFRTERDDGVGLGLWAAAACAELLGGALTMERSDLGGCCARITLPAV